MCFVLMSHFLIAKHISQTTSSSSFSLVVGLSHVAAKLDTKSKIACESTDDVLSLVSLLFVGFHLGLLGL